MPTNDELKQMADKLRIHSINETTKAGSGHPTSCMSCADILSVLFFKEYEKDDEFILSKGHAAPILWAVFAESNIIPTPELNHLRDIHSILEGHPTKRMPCTKIATGSLGQGLSAGVGIALAKKLKDQDSTAYVLLGDGECAEGSVWEAASSASYYSLNNLVAIIDVNRLGQSQQTMHKHDIDAYERKFKAFGWNTVSINGHSINDLRAAFSRAKRSKKPFAIIAKTIKGKGFPEIEDKNGFHGKPLSHEKAIEAMLTIGRKDITLKPRIKQCLKPDYKIRPCKRQKYEKNEKVATRDAFGRALENLGRINKNIVAIDGDVRNSTRTEKFFDEFPEKSFEVFIAEQNMTGISIGLSSQNLVPFMSTFAAFLTRAHDFIRMAQYSNVNLNIIGSHTGVSIGEDGPSQMGLEDIPMFLSMPGSVILNPCDAVSADALTIEMAKNKGIVYLRTIREKTPVIYTNNEKFKIGKLNVIRASKKDEALVIASGITVHEALKAYDLLKEENTHIRIIDLYSIKPLDEKTLRKEAERFEKIIVVEDNYDGAIGPQVSRAIGKDIEHLYVKKMPRSGSPSELRHKYGIGYKNIIKEVKR